MWRIERTNDKTALAIGARGDTLAELARAVRLDDRERGRWLSGATFEASWRASDLTLERETAFEIPNVVFLAWFGEWGTLGKRYMRWERNQARLRTLGFDVVLFDNDRYQKDKSELAKLDFFERLERCARDRSLYALYMMGHGTNALIGSLNTGRWWNRTLGPQWTIPYTDEDKKNAPDELVLGGALSYKLAALVVQACFSQNPNARKLVAENGLLWGAKGIYVPRPIDLSVAIL